MVIAGILRMVIIPFKLISIGIVLGEVIMMIKMIVKDGIHRNEPTILVVILMMVMM